MTERSEFEKVMVRLGYSPVWDGSEYLYEEVQTAWQAWQAARAQSGQGAEPVAWVAPTATGIFYGETAEEAAANAESFGATLAGTIPLYTRPQPAQQGGVPEGWSLTHIDDPATDGYLVKGPGIRYCAWKDKEPWLYLFCEALATTPQPQADGWVRCDEPFGTESAYQEAKDRTMGSNMNISCALFSELVDEFRRLKRPQPPKEGE